MNSILWDETCFRGRVEERTKKLKDGSLLLVAIAPAPGTRHPGYVVQTVTPHGEAYTERYNGTDEEEALRTCRSIISKASRDAHARTRP